MSTTETIVREELIKEKGEKVKINFESNPSENVEKLIQRGNPNFGLSMQVLSAKEIEQYIQKRFNILEFKVYELEAETTRRINSVFVPDRYTKRPDDEDTVTFLDDLLSQDDIIVSCEEATSWGNRKVKLSLRENSEFFTKEKVYSVGNTPKGMKIDIILNGKSVLKKPIFTVPGIKISSRTKNTLYKNIAIGGKFNCLERYESKDYISDNLYKVLDLNYIVSLCSILENCYMYMDQDTSFMYNTQNSFYGLDYTTEDFLKVLNLNFLTEKNINIPNKIEHMICESALAVTHEQMSSVLYDRYMRESNIIYNKIFSVKQSLSDKIKAVIDNSAFLDTFSYVEIEENANIEKFYLIENEFEKLKDILKLDRFVNKDVELIFRKIGNPKENGLYFKEQSCLCVDMNNISSFAHEIAHLVDSRLNTTCNASMSSDFRILAIKYIKELEKNSEDLDKESLDEYKKGRMNYHTPTEVFARAFEMYLSKVKRLNSSFIKKESDMSVKNGYPILTDELLNMIDLYFSNIFELEFNLNISSEETNNDIVISNVDNQNAVSSEEDELLDDNIADSDDITIIEGINGENFIFKIVEDARGTNQRPRYSSRRRRLNKSAVNEENLASQITFF